jgi:hypothetical protein
MRVIFGIVLGAIITVAGAYYRDSTYASPASANPEKPLVNWDVAGELAGNTTRAVRREFDRLIAR